LPSYRRPDRFIGHGLTTHASNNGNNGNNGSNGSNGNIGHVGHAAPTISDPLGRALDGIESAHASANGAMTAASIELPTSNIDARTSSTVPLVEEPQSETSTDSNQSISDTLSSRSSLSRGRRGPHALNRLRAVVLLGGQLRPSPLMLAIQRSVLDLPVLQDRTLLNHWLVEVAELGHHAGLDKLPARLMVSQESDEILSACPTERDALTVERDASEFRGTGGVLADLARGYAPDDYVLVANAAQLLLEPLTALAVALDHKRSDVAMISHLDGTPGGLMLIRCAALSLIKPAGFVDMKEQALPRISKQFDVRVVHCRRPTGLPLRTTSDYIGAMRHWHRGIGVRPGSRRGQLDPLAEDFSAGFSIVETGASVDPTAYLHDSIVLKGARVEANSAVVRSLVGPGAVVRHDARVIDEEVVVSG